MNSSLGFINTNYLVILVQKQTFTKIDFDISKTTGKS